MHNMHTISSDHWLMLYTYYIFHYEICLRTLFDYPSVFVDSLVNLAVSLFRCVRVFRVCFHLTMVRWLSKYFANSRLSTCHKFDEYRDLLYLSGESAYLHFEWHVSVGFSMELGCRWRLLAGAVRCAVVRLLIPSRTHVSLGLYS